MSFRRKKYPEVADNLLNRLLGGVSGEMHAYPPPNRSREPYSHVLLQAPVQDISSVYGLANGNDYLFVKDVDYALKDGGQLLWQKEGQRPDAGSVFEVNYFPQRRETRINDLYPGSVVRTLLETVALEIAALYAQMDTVYRSAFIETAEGGALEHVVALLGLERVKAGRNTAEIEFRRAKNSRGEIHIPAGTRVLTADGAIEYETLSEAMLSDSQPSTRIVARDLIELNDGLPAQSLTLLAKPIAGIESVDNPAPTTRLDRDESDAELRERAKSFLAGSERGTLGALKAVVAKQGLIADIDDSTAGYVEILIHNDQLAFEHKLRLEASIQEVKPAGIEVHVSYGPQPSKVDLEIRLATVDGFADTELKAIQGQIRARVAEYFAKLPLQSVGSVSKLIGLAMGVTGVEDVSIVSAKIASANVLDKEKGILSIASQPTALGTLTLVDPALAIQLTAVMRYTKDVAIPDQTAMQIALQGMVSYLNDLSTKPGIPVEQRTLSFGKLALVTPRPAAVAVGLDAYDLNPVAFSLPEAADLSPYELRFVFSRANGVSHIIDSEASPALILLDAERISLTKVSVDVKPKGGGV